MRRGRKRLGRKHLSVRIRDVGKGLIVRISSSDDVEKGIAVYVVDRCEGPLMASFVFVLVVVELLHHLAYVDAGDKLHAAAGILLVKLVKRNDTRQTKTPALTMPAQAFRHSRRRLNEGIRL